MNSSAPPQLNPIPYRRTILTKFLCELFIWPNLCFLFRCISTDSQWGNCFAPFFLILFFDSKLNLHFVWLLCHFWWWDLLLSDDVKIYCIVCNERWWASHQFRHKAGTSLYYGFQFADLPIAARLERLIAPTSSGLSVNHFISPGEKHVASLLINLALLKLCINLIKWWNEICFTENVLNK